MTWGQFLDILKNCPGRDSAPEGENVVESVQIQRAADAGMAQNGLDLRSENKRPAGNRIKERPDAQSVAGEEETLSPGVPDCKRPLAVHTGDAIFAVLPVKV